MGGKFIHFALLGDDHRRDGRMDEKMHEHRILHGDAEATTPSLSGAQQFASGLWSNYLLSSPYLYVHVPFSLHFQQKGDETQRPPLIPITVTMYLTPCHIPHTTYHILHYY